ncbi:MAG TPA: O-antigen ligase family protein [Terriglobales bacterium]|nr:O-antigen ligase family protein [Terriglobales bacterium]
MSVAIQSATQNINTSSRAFLVGVALSTLALVGLLGALGISLIPFALVCAAALTFWLAFRYPMSGLGGFLAFIPVYTLAFLVAKFFGPRYLGSLEGIDRVVLLLFTCILWYRNRVRLTLPDKFLLVCFGLALLRLAFSGTVLGFLTDFNFLIAYAAGRVTVLNSEREQVWAKRAVWIIAVISVLGMIEVFYIGEAPRTVLYLAVANGGTSGQTLDAAFHANEYSGLRESATMFGPLQFAPLCMAALVIWWVYSRKPLPGMMIAAGLVCSVTRSAWLGTAVAVVVLAIAMNQTKRLIKYGAIALVMIIIAIPLLGLTDYLLSTKAGEDPSSQSHQESLLGGMKYVVTHPLGTGPGSVGKFAVKQDENAAGIEDTYLTLAAQYGLLSLFCFVGFLASAALLLWRAPSQRSYVGVGILAGFSTVMMFAALHDVFPLACWLWFPVGLGIRSISEAQNGNNSTPIFSPARNT